MTRPIPHGTYRGYRFYRCRQQCCTRAAYLHSKAMRLAVAEGTWRPWGDTDQARSHLRMLYIRGWDAGSLSRRIGHAPVTIRRILDRPHERKRRDITDALMAVSLSEVPDQEPMYRISRRLQSLARQGWSAESLALELDLRFRTLDRLRRGRERSVSRLVADRILAGYDALREAPSLSPRADRLKQWAWRQGWLSDIEWDGLIDLPDQELRAELDRQVALLEPEDLAAAHTAYGHHKERSLLVVAAASEYNRRQWAARKERTCA